MDALRSGQGSRLKTGVETLVTYARNAIYKANERPINTLTDAFKRRFVWDDALIQAFHGIGFDFDSATKELVLSPQSGRKASAQVALEELALWLVFESDGQTPMTADDQRYNTYYFPKAEPAIRRTIGAVYKPRPSPPITNLKAFKHLGITADLPDDLIELVYNMQCMDDPEHKQTYYEALSMLSNYYDSPALKDLARAARYQGFYTETDVHEAYRLLGATDNTIDDELLISAYQLLVADHANRYDEAHLALRLIASSRSSDTIKHFLATDRIIRLPEDSKEELSLEESYELLEAGSLDDVTIQNIYVNKITDYVEWAPYYTTALKVIARYRQSAILTQYLKDRGEDVPVVEEPPMTVEEASRHMGLIEDSIDDDMMIDVYNIRVQDQPAQSETLKKALRTIGEARNSKKIVRYIETGSTAAPVDVKNPVGLQNIGNTCYLNSILQYYFTIKPLRDAVLSAEPSTVPSRKRKRIGGREITEREVDRSNNFTTHLRQLYNNLINTATTSIAPDENLAYLALVSSKDEAAAEEVKAQEVDMAPAISKSSDDGFDLMPELEPSVAPQTDVIMSEAAAPLEADRPQTPPPTVMDKTSSPYDEVSLVPTDDANMKVDELPTYDSVVGDSEVNLKADSTGKKKPSSIDSDATMASVTLDSSAAMAKTPKQKIESQMMFGRQNDVTECMDNVMFQLEAADGKPVSESEEIIKGLFYGQMRQFLDYLDPQSGSAVSHTKVEEFTHIILDVGEEDKAKDLYDGLDEYFYVANVEWENTQAQRHVTIVDLPPILQIQLQRVQFDRTQNRVYKSNAYVKFDEIIYMDRYLDKNHEILKSKKDQVANWRQELGALEEQLKRLLKDVNNGNIAMHEVLTNSADFLREHDFMLDVNTPAGLQEALNEGADEAQADIEHLRREIATLQSNIKGEFGDLQQDAYHVHSVFMHRGQATYGHYWIYIRDFANNRWFKYNDETVTEVDVSEVMAESSGNANPYMITYVRGDQIDYIDTVRRQIT